MVELRNRRLLIDGAPVLLLAGEIHYFRLRRADWHDRIRKLKEVGCNAVSSYVPWIVHEEAEGEIDVQGRLRPENDLGAFIDLCHREGLWFLPRPGPFVMAEMKNEGIPFWVYEKHPDSVPVSWDGQRATSRTLDYLNPSFLASAKHWYAGVMPVFASRLQNNGGPIIGVQLDNEIGMLSWVTNQPDLSDDVLCDLTSWIGGRYTHEELGKRYPFDWNDPFARAKAVRNPAVEYQAALHRDYGDFERNRFARYIATLREYAESFGVKGVPFIVNIHGSGGGRGTQFPIGIHQLYESYTQAPGYLAGSDHYLGDLTRGNVQDLHYINAFMAAVNRPEQPLSSMEFEVGSGDYGESGALRYAGAAADFKVRMSIIQGNRLINYYLLAGGHNPPLIHPSHDGNDRIGTTGERHGFAAPVGPEGRLDPTFFSLKETTSSIMAVAHKLADMDEEHDPVALAFIPDYYKTDFHRPGPMEAIVRSLEQAREPLENISRTMLALGFRFSAVDIQNRDLDVKQTPALVLASAAHLDRQIQVKLVKYLNAGGRLLLQGRVPTFDMEGQPCTSLSDALAVHPLGIKEASVSYALSLQGVSWLAGEPEVRNWQVQALQHHPGAFLRIVQTEEVCGVEAAVGLGRAIVMTCNYPSHLAAYRTIFERLGLHPELQNDDATGGLIVQSTRSPAGERLLSVLNLDLEEKRVKFQFRGQPIFQGQAVRIGGRKALLLPFG